MQSTATQNKVQKSKGHAGRNAAAQRRTSLYSRVHTQLYAPTTPPFLKKTAMAGTDLEGTLVCRYFRALQHVRRQLNVLRYRLRDDETAPTKNATLMIHTSPCYRSLKSAMVAIDEREHNSTTRFNFQDNTGTTRLHVYLHETS